MGHSIRGEKGLENVLHMFEEQSGDRELRLCVKIGVCTELNMTSRNICFCSWNVRMTLYGKSMMQLRLL